MTDPAPAGTLPIDPFRGPILQTLDNHPLLILTAETGAGKSTRIPLWLWQRGLRVRVTQPRRIAARSLSHYLAHLTGTPWGGDIGFQTGLDRRCSRHTKLLYLTDGVQMQREVQGRRDCDVLVVDEVHEWNLNQETLVGMVRQNLEKGRYGRGGQRVVIMSATLQANQLSRFLGNAPVIAVPGRGFPVTMHRHHPDFMLSDVAQLVEARRNILVFLPGKKEISDFRDLLERSLKEDNLRARILPLHGELGIREQARVFRHYSEPKVVLATDIAQTSLTIDDIDTVIDSGIKKEVQTRKGIEGLYPVDISRAECLQRAGRAGRVRSGQYILCAEREMDERPDFPDPEIRRLNLESVVLRMINWGISPRDFPFFHPPRAGLVTRALRRLAVYGAVEARGSVTADGQRMAGLPVSIRSGRMLLEATKSTPGVQDAVLKAIAIMEAGGIVHRDFPGAPVHESRYQSDLINQIAIWNARRQFREYVHFKKLSMASEIVRELRSRLHISPAPGELSPREEAELIRALISGFAEWVYRRVGDVYTREEEEARRLDRQSILAADPPEWITGQPFDLQIQRENSHTGERETIQLNLISFATRITLDMLEDLAPFSYRHERAAGIREHTVSIRHRVFFGEQLIAEYKAAPDWTRAADRDAAIAPVLRWIREQGDNLPLNRHRERLERDYARMPPQTGRDLPPFAACWDHFLRREITRRLRTDRLDLFFHFDRFRGRLQLHRLLPGPVVKRLRRAHWPAEVEIAGRRVKVMYTPEGPRAKLPIRNFEKAVPEELALPTGEALRLDLDGRECPDWSRAVAAFNQWKHGEIFHRRWRSRQRPARMQDVVDLDFPLAFEGGKGMENEPLVFFTAPRLEGDEVFLIHFPDRESALGHMQAIREQWQARRTEFQRRELEKAFRKKGWRIKS